MNQQRQTNKGIRQKLSRLDELGDIQLNELLEKLERQKQKLPIEDHPIIDWGISVIRAKALEEERLRRKMFKEFDDRYTNYQTFLKYCAWERYDLDNDTDEDALFDSGIEELSEILTVACQKDDDRYLDYATRVKEHLSRFCNERGKSALYKTTIKQYVDYYSGDDFANDPNPRIRVYAQKLAQCLEEA